MRENSSSTAPVRTGCELKSWIAIATRIATYDCTSRQEIKGRAGPTELPLRSANPKTIVNIARTFSNASVFFANKS
jgi:hypothetical protein